MSKEYEERYPKIFEKLSTHFPVTHKEVFKQLKTHYSDIFNLDYIEENLTSYTDYINFFNRALQSITDEMDDTVRFKKLADYLNINFVGKESIKQSFVLKGQSWQLGYVEKLSQGTISSYPHLTRMDMLRAASYYRQNLETTTRVHTFSELESLGGVKKGDAYLVNLSRSSDIPPRWVCVDINSKSNTLRVYSESPLTVEEKKSFEVIATQSELKSVHYEGQDASASCASGLLALAHLNTNILDEPISAMIYGADYPALQDEFIWLTTIIMNLYKLDENAQNRFKSFVSADCTEYRGHYSRGQELWRYSCAISMGFEDSKYDFGDLNEGSIRLKEKISSKGSFSKVMIDEQIVFNYFTNMFGLDAAMMEYGLHGDHNILEVNNDNVILRVPNLDEIHSDKLLRIYGKHCGKYKVGAGWLNSCIDKYEPSLYSRIQKYAISMLLTALRVKARKRRFTIEFPINLKLNSKIINYLIRFLKQQPYIEEITLKTKNKDLEKVVSAAAPSLARNKWLHSQGYLPPLRDNYWRRAAEKWLVYLSGVKDFDMIYEAPEHKEFLDLTKKMSLSGVKAVLNLLKDETWRIMAARLFTDKSVGFNANSEKNDSEQVIDELNEHLKYGEFFPFNKLSLSYTSGLEQKAIDLIAKLNKLSDFESVTLTGLLTNASETSAHHFIKALTGAAIKDHWLVPIRFPEFDKEDGKYSKALISAQRLLNDVIKSNRREVKAKEALGLIKDVEKDEDKEKLVEKDEAKEKITSLNRTVFNRNKRNFTTPIQPEVGPQLEVQQQQEVAIKQQVKVERKVKKAKVDVQALPEVLVRYDNIDELLGDYCKKHSDINLKVLAKKYAHKRNGDESNLQVLFRTWVSANIEAKGAKHVISSMTIAAVKKILNYANKFASGIQPDNLPTGFFLQRNEYEDLVLGFKAELGYTTGEQNEFTVALYDPEISTKPWEGDFRQFDVQSYLKQRKSVAHKDFMLACLYANLQPELSSNEIDKLYGEFIKNNKYKFEKKQVSFIKDHWHVFYQLWLYAGDAGINYCLSIYGASSSIDVNNDSLSQKHVISVLLMSNDSELLQPRLNEKRMRLYSALFSKEAHGKFALKWFNDRNYRALGQVYNEYGSVGVDAIMSRLYEIELFLGDQLFMRFKEIYLDSINNYRYLVGEKDIAALDGMIRVFKKNSDVRNAFVYFSEKHFKGAGFERHCNLWNAFEQLRIEGIQILPDTFSTIKKGNMIVMSDRIYRICKNIPEEAALIFIKNLSEYDLSHGGIYYAVTHEGFVNLGENLKLANFENGKPTYRPVLSDIAKWRSEDLPILFMRAFASDVKFTGDDYNYLSEHYKRPILSQKNELVLLILCQLGSLSAKEAVKVISSGEFLSDSSLLVLTRHLLSASYDNGQLVRNINVTIDSLQMLKTLKVEELKTLFKNYNDGAALESLTVFKGSKRPDSEQNNLYDLLNHNSVLRFNRSVFRNSLIKISILMGQYSGRKVADILEMINHMSLFARRQLLTLFAQIMSIDFDSIKGPIKIDAWKDFESLVDMMAKNPAKAIQGRIQYIDYLRMTHGLMFDLAVVGDYRQLNKDEGELQLVPRLTSLGSYKERIEHLIQSHILIPSEYEGSIEDHIESQLSGIMDFFWSLKLSQSFIDEIEPILSALSKIEPGTFWTAEYLTQLLNALQPDDKMKPFPLNLFCEIIREEAVKPKDMSNFDYAMPDEIISMLKTITNSNELSLSSKSLLSKMALRDFYHNGTTTTSLRLLNYISEHVDEALHSNVLKLVLDAGPENYISSVTNLQKLIGMNSDFNSVKNSWNDTVRLWLSNIDDPNIVLSLNTILSGKDVNKLSAILHIIAYGLLAQGLLSESEFSYQKIHKLTKLMDKLNVLANVLSNDELEKIANLYPATPSPSATRLLWAIKEIGVNGRSVDEIIAVFKTNPTLDIRRDYRKLLVTREEDLRRMLRETKVRRNGHSRSLNVKEVTALGFAFNYLKSLESGEVKLDGLSISSMTQEQIQDHLAEVSQNLKTHPDDLRSKVELWALLFEALGRTTGKYPHLAQQYALIADELDVATPTRALRLSTGEGKSHFVALRAARHVLMGKTVEICTAKDTLAQRDQKDYQTMFDYIGVKTAHIHAKSSLEDYTDAKVHYTTLGSLSLFLDERSNSGQTIKVAKGDRVILFDEFDYIFYEEGLNTGYNYACSTGLSPKQMMWFYQALTDFYDDHLGDKVRAGRELISKEPLDALLNYMEKCAGGDPGKLAVIQKIITDGPELLAKWLQSTHQAARMKQNKDFTVRAKTVEYGGVQYPMREIIPLSRDNQPVIGSSFSDGVHQLLAYRMNKQQSMLSVLAPRDFHIHPESLLLSSQIAIERTRQLTNSWEGFSGSVSSSQAYQLSQEFGTTVLDVPTNRRDRREWKAPHFSKDNTAYENKLVERVKDALSNKKSILFACRDDNEVKEVDALLKRRLSQEEYAQVMPYTNEDTRTNEELLDAKKSEEQWVHGKKQKGICLIASGLGRGDNVGVEVVMITQVRDQNDLLQKGGRTARGGASGYVEQFYKVNELKEEYTALLRYCNQLSGDNEKQQKFEENQNGYEKLFKTLLGLREKRAYYSSLREMQYKRIKAQFSAWVMKQITGLKSEEFKNTFRQYVFQNLANAAKVWSRLQQSDASASVVHKSMGFLFTEIPEIIGKHVNEMHEGENIKFTNFVPRAYKPIASMPKKGFTTDDARMDVMIEIGVRIARMTWSPSVVKTELDRKLTVLKDHPHLLADLAQRSRTFKTIKEFDTYLTQLVKKIERGLSAVSKTPRKMEALLSSINETTKRRFDTLMIFDKFPKPVTDSINAYLLTQTGTGINSKVWEIIHLLEYLIKFDGNQTAFFKGYMGNLFTLMPPSESTGTVDELYLTRVLNSVDPLPYPLFRRVWKLGEKYDLISTELKTLSEFAVHIEPKKIQEVDYLYESETLMTLLGDKKDEFIALTKFQLKFVDADEHALFKSFCDLFKKYWSQRKSVYQSELHDLLKKLYYHNNFKLPEDKMLFEGVLQLDKQGGKFSFQVLSAIMGIEPKVRRMHQETILAMAKELATPKFQLKSGSKFAVGEKEVDERTEKKQNRLNLFKRHLKSLTSDVKSTPFHFYRARYFLAGEPTDDNMVQALLRAAVEYAERYQNLNTRPFFLPHKHSNQLQAGILINRLVKMLEHPKENQTGEELKQALISILLPVMNSLSRDGQLSRGIRSVVREKLDIEMDKDTHEDLLQALEGAYVAPNEEAVTLGVLLSAAGSEYLENYPEEKSSLFHPHANQPYARKLRDLNKLNDPSRIHDEALLLLKQVENPKGKLATSIISKLMKYHGIDQKRLDALMNESKTYAKGSDIDKICDAFYRLNEETVPVFNQANKS